MKRAAVLGYALTLVLGACGGRSAESPPLPLPSPSPVVLPNMWSAHPDGPQGFSVAVPDGWVVAVRDSPSYDHDLRAVTDRSAELGQYFAAAFGKHDQLRLLAADPAGLQQGFATNVNVMISDLGVVTTAPTLDDVARAKVKRLRATAGVTTVTQHPDRLAGLPAVRFDYPLTANGTSVLVRSVVAVVDRGGRRYLVELTMGAAQETAPTLFTAEERVFRVFTPSTRRPPPSTSPSPTADQQGAAG